ncbi:hypothetical protein Y032_0011g1246 [Ancylostoma ceylanicum]|nr:hypothetical protein Y032_0011g1246 [Ancylostoma ceylanicum]
MTRIRKIMLKETHKSKSASLFELPDVDLVPWLTGDLSAAKLRCLNVYGLLQCTGSVRMRRNTNVVVMRLAAYQRISLSSLFSFSPTKVCGTCQRIRLR